jgi:hypothetical protein
METNSNYYNATIICSDGSAKKYHDINKYKLSAFELWAASKFPNAHHVNYYSKDGTFIAQRKMSM